MSRSRVTSAFLCLLILFLDAAFSIGSQQPAGTGETGKNPEQARTFSIKVPVDVVVVSATVTDKKGNPVRNLTVEDFQIFEDGKPQLLHTFAMEAYQPRHSRAPLGSQKEVTADVQTATTSASVPRLLRVVVDDLTMREVYQQYFLMEALRKFIAEDLSAGDQVSLSTASGSVDLPFASDREQIMKNLVDLESKTRPLKARFSECPPLTDLQAHNIANDLEDGFSLAVGMKDMELCDPFPSILKLRMEARAHEYERRSRTRTLLASLRSTVRVLKHFEGKKVLILCSTGFLSQEFTYQLQDLIEASLRSGVVINTIDPSGLTSNAPTAEERTAGIGILFAQKSMMHSVSKTAQEGPLIKLAGDTGGQSFSNNNDLHAGLKTIAARASFFYILSYASPNAKADGRFHTIRLEVKRPELSVSYRKGYYAPKEQLSYEGRSREDILDALREPGNMNEIPIRVSFNYTKSDDAHYAVDLISEINLRRVQFAQKDGRHKNAVRLVMAIFDEVDRYVDGYEKSMDFNLSDSSFDSVSKYGLSSRASFTLAPGRYKVKAVVRESNKTWMGSAEKIVELP